jgi:O-antigen ligase
MLSPLPRPFTAPLPLAAALAALGVAAGLAAAASPKLAVGAAAGLVFVAVAVRAPAVGLGLFTVLAFFSVITEGSNLTVIKLAGLVLAGTVAARSLRSGGVRANLFRDHPWLAWLAVAFGVWASASMMWALQAATAETNAERLVEGLVLVFVVYGSVRTAADLRLVLWAFMAGALLAAVYGLIHGSTNPNATTRLSGGIGDPNELAASLVPSIAFAIALYATARRRGERALVLACVAVVCPALFLTQSRGGLLAFSAMVLVTVLFERRLRARAIVLTGVVASVGIAYFTLFASASAAARIQSAGDGTGRVDLWSVALRMVHNHPLAGVGMGNFPAAAPAYTPGPISLPRFDLILFTPEMTHNTYLQTLAELGGVGLAVLLGLIAGAFAVAIRAIRGAPDAPAEAAWLSRGTVIAAVGMFTAYVFFSAQFEKQLWLILGLLATLPAVLRAHRAEAA